MDTLTIELPPQREQTTFNLRRWTELLADPEMQKIEGRVETDRHGHVMLSPILPAQHGRFQAEVSLLLQDLLPLGRVSIVCPLSTADGVRLVDVLWASSDRMSELGDGDCFSHAPEIWVEVISPDNTAAALREKTALYFDAGAEEVWHCALSGQMTFFVAGEALPLPASRLCPNFPAVVQLR